LALSSRERKEEKGTLFSCGRARTGYQPAKTASLLVFDLRASLQNSTEARIRQVRQI